MSKRGVDDFAENGELAPIMRLGPSERCSLCTVPFGDDPLNLGTVAESPRGLVTCLLDEHERARQIHE